jgi:hypothetical protein
MAREVAILGVPEFSMRDQTIILGVPEFSMRERKIVLRIPDFTLKQISVESGKIKDKSQALATKTKAQNAQLTERFKAEVEKVSASAIASTFD